MIGKITKFSDIPIFTRDGSYQVDVDIRHIPGWIKDMEDEMGLELNPGFQRGHVWTRDQQIAWLEFFLRGGKTGNNNGLLSRDGDEVITSLNGDIIIPEGITGLNGIILQFLQLEIPKSFLKL